MSAPKLAVIAAELYRDLQEIGFGKPNDHAGGDFVERAELVELMSRYFERLEEATNRAVGRPARQEALPLD